jgi:Transglycosylase SLT domain
MIERRIASTGPDKPKPKRGPIRRVFGVAGRDLAIVAGAVAAIVVAVRTVRPIFTNQPSVAQALEQRSIVAKAALAPTPADSDALARVLASPQFAADRAAFSADLVRTGRMSPERADSISFYAVREAYLHNIPPAVIFGVMLTENSLFVSNALSSVGAVGLMQVYPKVWRKALQATLGRDIATDSTNIKYGVFILSEYLKSSRGPVQPSQVSRGLLHYNGCIVGPRRPHCANYPLKVSSFVERQGASLCGDLNFAACIARNFTNGFLGKPWSEMTAR